MEIFFLVLVILFLVFAAATSLSRLGSLSQEIKEIKHQLSELLKHNNSPIVRETAEELPVSELQEEIVEEPEEQELVPRGLEGGFGVFGVETQMLEEEEAPEPEEFIQEIVETPDHDIALPEKAKAFNYEKFIGENIFGKIGILILVVGVGFFVKYAIDQNWISEVFRTILGFMVGLALLGTASKLEKKYRTFSSLLAGGAFGVFYTVVAIAFHYYHLFSQTTAFVLLIAITLLMPVLAVLYNRRELAIIALVGGFAAPFLVSSGSGSYLTLFIYLTCLNVAMFGLSVYKKWSELPILSFVFTYVIFVPYTLSNIFVESVEEAMVDHLFLFATLFYFVFLLPVASILRSEGEKASRVLLSVIIANNFIYLGMGAVLLGNMLLPFKAEGLLSLFIAIVNLLLVLWLRKRQQDYKFLIYAMLGLVLTFVSITVPLQMKGNFITLFWASEMVLLLWLYIKSKIRVYEYGSFILVILTLFSFLMDLPQAQQTLETEIIFLNHRFATFLFMGLATGAFAWLMARFRGSLSEAKILKYSPWNALMIIASTIITYYTFLGEFCLHLDSNLAVEVSSLFTAATLLVVCNIYRKRFPFEQYSRLYVIGTAANVFTFLIFVGLNILAPIVSGVFPWLIAAVVVANLYDVSRQYYQLNTTKLGYTIYLSVAGIVLWLAAICCLLDQIGISDEFSAAFSIGLSMAGFVLMSLGMRLHQKVLRIASLSVFGIVLFKLLMIDLWAMPTIGKILVFILLGVILLLLSFLYQKLKNALFKDDEN